MTTPEEDGTSSRSTAEAPLPGATAATEAAATEASAAPATAADGAAPTVTPARPHRANSVTALLVISALVAAGGVGYAVGHATATGQTGTDQTIGGPNGRNGQNGQNGRPAIGPNASGVPVVPGGQNANAAPAAGAVSGTVVSVTPSSITIRLPNGRIVTIPTGSSTVYSVQEPATISDVTVGATVIVRTSGGTGAASASAGTATQVIITGK